MSDHLYDALQALLSNEELQSMEERLAIEIDQLLASYEHQN